MPTVVLSREIARRFTDGETRIELTESADTVREIVRTLDARYPGLGMELRSGKAVAIDGQIYQDALLESVGPSTEVCFMPAIEGG